MTIQEAISLYRGLYDYTGGYITIQELYGKTEGYMTIQAI